MPLCCSQCLFAVIGLAAVTVVGRAAAVEFEPRPQYHNQQQLYAGSNGYYSYADGSSSAAGVADGEDYDDAQPSSRIHHGKHKHKLQKKLKKRLLLQCLLEHRRRRRDTGGASGRLLLPVVLQSTNVNVAPGGGSYGGGGGSYGGGGGGSYGGMSGCMHLGNGHGPLGSLGPSLGSLGSFGSQGAPVEEMTDEGTRRLSADWNRYARRFHRNFVRPLYQLF